MASFAIVGFPKLSSLKEWLREAAIRTNLEESPPETADIVIVWGWRRPKNILPETKWIAVVARGCNTEQNKRLACWQGATEVMLRPADSKEACLALMQIVRLAA